MVSPLSTYQSLFSSSPILSHPLPSQSNPIHLFPLPDELRQMLSYMSKRRTSVFKEEQNRQEDLGNEWGFELAIRF